MVTGQSWKTTSAGISLVVAGIVGLVFAYKNGALTEAAITGAATSILGGIGFIFAKDSNVTGGTIVSASNDPQAVAASNSNPPPSSTI